MLQFHPKAYIVFISASLQLVIHFCFSQSCLLVPEFERFNVNLLNLMKDIVMNTTYRPTLDRKGIHYDIFFTPLFFIPVCQSVY